jgi:hypothetical protein
MSIERELLKRFMIELTTEEDVVSLFNDIKECLAEPEQTEQEPVAWMYEWVNEIGEPVKSVVYNFYEDVNLIPLYTAPPKREPPMTQREAYQRGYAQAEMDLKRKPFKPEERQRLSKAYSTRAEQVAFEEGIIFAEISYGIGVGE